jgi:hypothetical protein
LIVGRARQNVPASGHAQLEKNRADSGPFRAYSWPVPDAAGSCAFVAAVRLPLSTYLLPGQILCLASGPPTEREAFGAGLAEPPRDPSRDLGRLELRLPPTMAGPEGFIATAVAQLAGAGGAARAGLALFLLATFPPSAMRRVPVIGAMLAALLTQLAVEDGCIELLGAVPGACGFLQGWGGPIDAAGQSPDGSVEAVLVGERVVRCQVRIATFTRPDILPPSGGMVLVVNHSAGQGPDAAILAAFPGLEHVYLLTQTGVLRRSVVEMRLLNPADSSGHIRDMLPSLSCPARAADCLRLALRPRYAGRETLSTQKLPVRAAIDHALLLPPDGEQPGGVYVCGWLFDPLGCVAEVTLRGLVLSAAEDGGLTEAAVGAAVRLDTNWTRVERDDVSRVLTSEGFPPANHELHGFAAYAPGDFPADGPLYLDLAFADATCAFLPVPTQPATAVAARARVLTGTDLHKPSGLSVIERQLGPLCLALMRRRPHRGKLLQQAELDPATNGKTGVVVVIPLVGAAVPPRAVLSQFLHDPLAPDETLLLVCGAAWADGALASLRRLLSFMGLHARVLHAAVTDAASALDVAAASMPARHYLLLDPATAGAAPGWRGALLRAVGSAQKPAVACPTLLYEDLSIRFAGAAAPQILPTAPYFAVSRKLAGMPAGFAATTPGPMEATIGTLTCCLIPAAVLPSVTGAATHLNDRFGQETAFFLRLQAAGVACLWVPQAVVYAPDVTDPAEPLPRVPRLVDGWCLRAAQQENGLRAAQQEDGLRAAQEEYGLRAAHQSARALASAGS